MFSKQGKSMFSHDYVFWCGDFNYRIDLTYEEVFYFLKRQDWKMLLEFDQLQQQKSSGKVRGMVLFAFIDIFPEDCNSFELKTRVCTLDIQSGGQLLFACLFELLLFPSPEIEFTAGYTKI